MAKIKAGYNARSFINVVVINQIKAEDYAKYLVQQNAETNIVYGNYGEVKAFYLESDGETYYFEAEYGDNVQLNRVSRTYILSNMIPVDLYLSMLDKYANEFIVYYTLKAYNAVAKEKLILNSDIAIKCIDYAEKQRANLSKASSDNLKKYHEEKRNNAPKKVNIEFSAKLADDEGTAISNTIATSMIVVDDFKLKSKSTNIDGVLVMYFYNDCLCGATVMDFYNNALIFRIPTNALKGLNDNDIVYYSINEDSDDSQKEIFEEVIKKYSVAMKEI